MSSEYFTNIRGMETTGDVDAITFEELDYTHPRSVITFYNGYSPETLVDYALTSYNTMSIHNLVERGFLTDPKTGIKFDKNQQQRICWYKSCLTKFPDIKHEDVLDYKKIISDWLVSPLEETKTTDMARYFITYDQIIDFYGFKDVETREKAELYFTEHPATKWIIRKSSLVDTQFNKFFVLMIKKEEGDYIYQLYNHRQGYGICAVDAPRFSTVNNVKMDTSIYFTNMVDFLIHYVKIGFIKL
jgi:hypothetical protein